MEPSTTEARIRELESVRKQINLWRAGSLVVVVGTMAICLGLLYNDAMKLAKDQQTQQVFVDSLKTQMNERVVPDIKETASRTLTEMQPVVQKEFLALNKRVPDVTKAALDQLNQLQTSLPETATKTLNDTFGEALKGKEAEIKSMYPDVTEDQVKALFTNLQTVTGERSQQVAQTLVQPHLDQLASIHRNLQAIEASEPKKITDTDDWQLGLAVFDVIREDVKDLKLPKGQAAGMISNAAGTISDAAKHVADTANQVSKTANEVGNKATQEGKK